MHLKTFTAETQRAAAALREHIVSPDIHRRKHHFGSVNQLVDSTVLLSKHELSRALRALYE